MKKMIAKIIKTVATKSAGSFSTVHYQPKVPTKLIKK